jgi:GAF domain-containing protein
VSGGERRQRIVDRLTAPGTSGLGSEHLCRVCVDVICVTGAGIMLMSGDIARGSMCSTDAVSALIEDLQYELGEGPCVDAYRLDVPVLEPDLAAPATSRWVAFTVPVLDAGVRAVFGFPLRVGAVRLGALNLYNTHVGPLTTEQHADALVMADVAAQTVLVLQADAPPGQLSVELETGADFQYHVHQAAGMVAVQLEVTVAQALIRLRAHAFGNDRHLGDVARDVLNRSLRFSADEDNRSSE